VNGDKNGIDGLKGRYQENGLKRSLRRVNKKRKKERKERRKKENWGM
jgi:hypothetical protein